MISKSGDKLLQDDAVAALTNHLLPLATVITPNLPEASVLLGRTIDTPEKMEDAAADLADLGAANVLVKGGHLTSGPGIDLLYETASGQTTRYTKDRVNTKNSHGTGCTLSSAIAAGLALGLDLKTAVAGAKTYITEALKAGADIQTGSGHGPVHHFYALWKKV
jgi:hydroxymethylpyrimidine/phosphomethylpyrimidine kinase